MNASDFETRLRAVISDLSASLTDEQIENAIASAKDITGITLPTTDPEMIEALLNRGEAVCLAALQNDWLPRFNVEYGGDSLSRTDVADRIERKLNRLDTRWEVLSKRFRPDPSRESRRVSTGTANRI